MPKILIMEIFQIVLYTVFGVVVMLTGLDLLLYFALGFAIAVSIPSLLLGYVFTGIKPAVQAGNSGYEKFRALPIANAIWGMGHLVVAFFIYLDIQEKFSLGINTETLLLAAGFLFAYLMVSLSQKKESEWERALP
ncbi:MAG: hypothetical protein JW969_05955 [Spirochaetales bacterium]|nr:hypothetical protein [Spirochaetales bacterium]